MAGTVAIVVVVVLAVVVGLGLLIFRLQRRAQDAVPRVADAHTARRDRVVAVEADGSAVTESEDVPDRPQRDPAGFDKVLSEELDALHRPGQSEPEDPDAESSADGRDPVR